MSYHCALPEDLIAEILVRLPVKSLLRLRSTCKLWNTIIKEPHFEKKHFHRESNPTRFIFCNYGFGTRMDREPYDKAFETHVLDTKVSYGYVKNLCGPCNGVFCVTYRDEPYFGLWNPTIRRFKLVPAPPKQSIYDDPHGIGFGVDPMTGEFKIMLLYSTIPGYQLEKVAIYTSSVNSWRYLNNGLLPDHKVDISRDKTASTLSNGFCYWVLYKHTETDAILAFDMHKEVFEVIEMPNVEMSSVRVLSSLGLCGNSLALMYTTSYPYMDRTEVWVMGLKGCWTRLYNVVTRVELFIHLGSKFFNESAGSWILCEDPHSSREETRLSIASFCRWTHLYLSCKESLALL